MSKLQTILITGAGSGLGRALSAALCGPERHLLLTDRNGLSAEETRKQLPSADTAEAAALDVTNQEQVADYFADLTTPVQVLINNAGLQNVAPLEEFEADRWDLLIDVMLNGAARMTRAALPGMRATGYGRIINIGSIHSLVASPYKSAYVAAKHGLLGLAKTVALETAEVDITVNTICPSYIRTPLVDKQIADQAAAHGIDEEDVIHRIMLEPMPKRAFISHEEIAATVEFLLSENARNITGQTITIDGGWTLK